MYAPTEGDADATAFDAATGDPVWTFSGESIPRLNVGPSLADGGLYLAGGNAVARFK